MAFPTTITTDGLGTVGCGGPYISSGGNVYVIVADDDRFDLRALKGSSPDTAFSAVGTDVIIGSSGDIIQSIAAQKVGDLIHVITKNSNGSNPVDIRYHVFDMSTDTWTTSNDMIKTNYATAVPGIGWRTGIGMAVRADGAVVAVYNGSYETVSTVQYDRVKYARKISAGAAWTVDFALGTAGVAASWLGGNVIVGGLDRLHFFLVDRTNAKLYHQTMDSGYSLGSVGASLSVSLEDTELSWMQGGVYVTASDIVTQPVYNSFETLHRVIATSSAAPVISISADITGTRSVLHNPIKYVASFAVDGSTLWNVFIDTANDIYTQNHIGGAWSTPTGFQTGSVSAVYANVYTRGSALVLGVVYHDTDPKYSEMTLSTIGVASVVSSRMLLTGVGV